MTHQMAAPAIQGVVYRCAPDVFWLRDADQVLLIAPQRGQSWSLCELEAAIWDWLVLDYEYIEIARLVSFLLKTTQNQAQKMLETTLHRWQDAGLIQVAPDEASVYAAERTTED
jgi:hypothetical protein